jgi:hypothetical protein
MDIKNKKINKIIFKKIAKEGPISLYELSNKKRNSDNPPYTSVRRSIENLIDEGWIVVFAEEVRQGGRICKTYIPTLQGIVHFFAPNLKETNQYKSQFKKWANEEKFYAGWEPIDVYNEYRKAPKQTMKNILLSTKFTDATDAECDKPIPDELRSTIGTILFRYKNLELFTKQYDELYNTFPPFQVVIDSVFSNLDTNTRQLKAAVDGFEVNPTKQTSYFLQVFGPMLTPKDVDEIIKSGKEPAFVLSQGGAYTIERVGKFKKILLSKLGPPPEKYLKGSPPFILQPFFEHDTRAKQEAERPGIIRWEPVDKFLSLSDVRFAMAMFARWFYEHGPLSFNFEPRHGSLPATFEKEQMEHFDPSYYDEMEFVSMSVSFNNYVGPNSYDAQEFFDKFEIFVPVLGNDFISEPIPPGMPTRNEAWHEMEEKFPSEIEWRSRFSPDDDEVSEHWDKMLTEFAKKQRQAAEYRWAQNRKRAKKQ